MGGVGRYRITSSSQFELSGLLTSICPLWSLKNAYSLFESLTAGRVRCSHFSSPLPQLAADYKLSEEDLLSEEVVRAKVADLIKLGEMRWRYRVVDEGKLPRDEAISTLSDARTLISEHIQLMAGRASTQEDINEQLQSGSKSWSAELSEVCQGLALARLVHNQDRTEDVEINSEHESASPDLSLKSFTSPTPIPTRGSILPLDLELVLTLAMT